LTLHNKVLYELCSALNIDSTHQEYSKFAKAGDLVNQAYFKIAIKEFSHIKISHTTLLFRIAF